MTIGAAAAQSYPTKPVRFIVPFPAAGGVDSAARIYARRLSEVLGQPIGRLYAAGELMGGFHGVAYMTGSSLGKCVIFGRIAGRNAAAEKGD